MANQVIDVVGTVARDAVMAASSSALLVSVEPISGFQTFASSSYNTGNVGNTELHAAAPVDAVVWRLVYGA